MAQNEVTSTPSEEQQKDEKAQPPAQEPLPVPIRLSEEERSLGSQSIIDDVFHHLRNRFGFSLSAFQAYTSDVSGDLYARSQAQGSSGITAFMSRAFFNVDGRRSAFHMDFGAGYRLYNRYDELNGVDYYASASYRYRFSHRASFQLVDQFTSSYNDAWSFLSLYSPIYYNFYYSNEVLFNRRRINRNAISTHFNYSVSRKAQLGVFSRYNLYLYPENSLRDADAFEVGASFGYQPTKWLSIDNGYSVYLNYVDEKLRDTRSHRIYLGGLNFHLGRSWELWGNAGISFANREEYKEEFSIEASPSAGVSYTTRNTAFYLTYQRGFTSAIGISELLMSDVVSAGVGHRFTNWMNARLESYYYNSSEWNGIGSIDTYTGGASLEFALRPNLFLTMSSYYQNQQTRNFSIEGLGLNRLSAYIGLQYVWPSRKRINHNQ